MRMVRACKGTNSNLATFDCAFTPQVNVGFGDYASYTEGNQPSGVSAMPLTYAWANAHSDSDDLIDGQELILGTNEFAADSDCDGQGDSAEYPLAAVSASDPMTNGNCADRRVRIYQDGTQIKLEMRNVGPTALAGVVFYFQGTSQLTLGTLNSVPSPCVQILTPLKYPVPGPGPRHAFRCTFSNMLTGTVAVISYTADPGMPYPGQLASFTGEVETFGTPASDPVSVNDTANATF